MDFDYLKIDNTRYLRVATYGRGIYETTDLVTDIHEKEILSQGLILVKPNPFKSEVKLEFKLQLSSQIRLCIYNQLGQLIYQTQENQPQGKQQLIWNAEGYAEGLYYYQLKVGDEVANGKMLKVR